MLKRIILPVIAVLVIVCAAAVFSYTSYFTVETVQTETPDEITVRFTDAGGNPIANVMCNICDNTSCTMLTSDAEGYVRFSGDFVPSKVQILKAPEGFAAEPGENLPLDADGETVIVLKAE